MTVWYHFDTITRDGCDADRDSRCILAMAAALDSRTVRHVPAARTSSRPRSPTYTCTTRPFTVRGGLEPDLLDEVTYWIEQYWQYALFLTSALCGSQPDPLKKIAQAHRWSALTSLRAGRE
jgi:hypothetical protein